MVGAGGWARRWINQFLPAFADRVSVVGLVDLNEEFLRDSGEKLGLPSDRLFTRMEVAFARIEADVCFISIPPAHHEQAALLAAAKGMDILSEKPIADSYDGVVAIHGAVEKNSLKMAITQNYRFEPPILAMQDVLKSGELGRLNYIVARYSHDYRERGAWSVDNVYERDYPLLIEGSIHHFDMLRNLAGSNCETMMGYGWNPEWSFFKSVSTALFLMQMENGVKAFYEGNSLEAGRINPWFHEQYRVECERGAVAVDRDQVVRVFRRDKNGRQTVEELPARAAPLTGHYAILTDFLNWLDGGKPAETRLSDNVHSAAMLFAAIGAIEGGGVVRVSDFLP